MMAESIRRRVASRREIRALLLADDDDDTIFNMKRDDEIAVGGDSAEAALDGGLSISAFGLTCRSG